MPGDPDPALSRPGELPVQLGSCLLGLLAFGIDQWPGDVDDTAGAMGRLVGHLRRS